MKIVESIKQIFDKKVACISGPNSECSITENKPEALFQTLTIKVSDTSCMYKFDTNFIEGMSNLTQNRSRYLLDSNCDGTLFVKSEDEKIHIVFVELKSNSNYEEAFVQLVHSYYKYHCICSLCEGYSLKDCSVDFVLACCKPKQDREAETVLDIVAEQNFSENDQVLTFSTDILPSLLYDDKHMVSFELGKYKIANNKGLSKDIITKQITMRLVMPDSPSDSYASLSLY